MDEIVRSATSLPRLRPLARGVAVIGEVPVAINAPSGKIWTPLLCARTPDEAGRRRLAGKVTSHRSDEPRRIRKEGLES
ncbi:unnamed protein product [Parajaminaea phylloscopi]